jgi:8-oxo-dGTP pyrophosphatase MutT (NUDIX family)
MLAAEHEPHRLLQLLTIDESELERLPSLSQVRVLAIHDDKLLLVFDRQRQRWQLPGSALSLHETAQTCALRALREETGNDCRPDQLRFVCAYELRLDPIEHGGLFTLSVEHIPAFLPNPGIGANLWWGGSALSHPLDAVDHELVTAFHDHARRGTPE